MVDLRNAIKENPLRVRRTKKEKKYQINIQPREKSKTKKITTDIAVEKHSVTIIITWLLHYLVAIIKFEQNTFLTLNILELILFQIIENIEITCIYILFISPQHITISIDYQSV